MTPNGIFSIIYRTATTDVDPPVVARQNIFSMPEYEKSKTRYLRQELVNNCCGVNWIAYFPHPVSVNGKFDYSLTVNQHLVNDVRQDMIKLVGTGKDIRSNSKLNSVSLIVLNHLQKPLYENLLKEFFFEPILEDAYHIGHGHMLTLYARKKYPDQKEKTSVQ